MDFISPQPEDYVWVFYIHTTPEQNKQIEEDLDKMYPNGYTKFDLYNYIKKISCEYCLECGHSSPTIKDPFKCPEVPTNFILKVKHIAKKYNANEEIVACMALKKRSRYKHYPGRYPNDIWSWKMLEDKINYDKKRKAKAKAKAKL
jgi:hypothetical protein